MLTVFSDESYMEAALQEAEEALQEGEIPVGALVVRRRRVLARAHNQTERLGDVTAHAEMLALTAAAEAMGGKYVHDCTLYVTLEPCAMCAQALHWAQLSRLVFAAADPRRGYRMYQPALLHPRTQVQEGIMADEARALIQRFFKQRRG